MTQEEFEELYDRLSAQVLSVAVYRVGVQDAADVCAETFEAVWKGRRGAPESSDRRAAWVAGIARHKALQVLQARRRKHHDRRFVADRPELVLVSAGPDVADLVVDALAGQRVYASLSSADQELFELAHIFAVAPDEAAAELGITRGAYATRLSRLRQRLELLLIEERVGGT